MKTKNLRTNVVSTDVLIIGGSIAGLAAAVKIKKEQESLDVLILDKGGIGWAGQVPTGGGLLIIVPPSVKLDEWVKWVADRGEGLSNIEWLYNFGGNLYDSMIELFNWDLPFMKDPDGRLHIDDVPSWRVKEKLTGWATHKVLLKLKKIAIEKGTRMMDKIEITDLLHNDGRIVGAVGFSIITGEFYVFKAKATLVASGACRYKNRRLWTMNCGELVAAAYRAGAQHLHSEFGTIHSNCSKVCQMWSRGAGAQDALVNALGERIMPKYFPNISESYSKTTYVMTKEVEAGRGPIYFDVSGTPKDYDEKVLTNVHRWTRMQGHFLNSERILREKGGIDLRSQKVEWVPGFIGGLGNIRVDLECKSPDLEGLWAAGDTIKTGLSMEGAVPPGEYAGWGLSLAIVTGLKAAKNIVRIFAELPEPKVRIEQQRFLEKEIFAPMRLKKKEFEPYDAVHRIQEAIVPTKYCVIRNEARLKESLSILEEVKEGILPKIKVENPHQLLKYHEARGMALCAEMTQRAAMYRTESRGSHIREDYTERDDQNWLNRTVIKNEDGEMKLSTTPVPTVV